MKALSLLITILILSINYITAQFTQKEMNVTRYNPQKIETINLHSKNKLNMPVYSKAYEDYLRKLAFQRRNRLTVKNTGVTLTQTAFSNWEAGGNNSFAAQMAAYIEHDFNIKRFEIKTVFDAAYGIQLITNKDDSDGNNEASRFQKTEDRFNFSVTPSYKITERWSATSSFIIKSQFSNSYISPGDTILASGFFSPGQFFLNAGITYSLPKKDHLSIYVAPVSGNLLTVINQELADQKKFGLEEEGLRFQPSFGAFMRIIYNENIYKDKVVFYSKLESLWEYDGYPTIWWENRLSFKITNLLSANIYCQIQYDTTIDTPNNLVGKNSFWQSLQINESFGLGLVLNLKPIIPVEDMVNEYVTVSQAKKKQKKQKLKLNKEFFRSWFRL